jgi:hypothetical protein
VENRKTRKKPKNLDGLYVFAYYKRVYSILKLGKVMTNMNSILKWVKLESIMIAIFQVKARSASKFNRFNVNHIRILECLD